MGSLGSFVVVVVGLRRGRLGMIGFVIVGVDGEVGLMLGWLGLQTALHFLQLKHHKMLCE